jgi:SAM-dependent methyltransferase
MFNRHNLCNEDQFRATGIRLTSMTVSTQSSPLTMTIDSFIRYLEAKRTVDNRALNVHVWQTLAKELPVATAERPMRVLEVGAGMGTMVERLVDQQMFGHTEYTALDENPLLIAELHRRLPSRIQCGKSDICLESFVGDAVSFTTRDENKYAWDLLIAHAFLDLVDLPTAVPNLLTCLKPGGLFYFSIVFDGATILQPEIDPVFDAYIEQLYHLTMDQRLHQGQPSGTSRSGRHLLSNLQQMDAILLAAGASDWIVYGGPKGYPADEAFFLHFIIHTIYTALRDHPDLDPDRFSDWVTERHAQIESAKLVFVAHQLDFLGRVPAGLAHDNATRSNV